MNQVKMQSPNDVSAIADKYIGCVEMHF